jgi:hypothetical protein
MFDLKSIRMIDRIVNLIASLGFTVKYEDENIMLDMALGEGDHSALGRVHAYGLTTEDRIVYINNTLTGNKLLRFLIHELVHVVRDANRMDEFKGMMGQLKYAHNELETEYITMCILRGMGIDMWFSHIKYFITYGMMICQIRNHIDYPQYDQKHRDKASSIFTMIMKG